MSKSKLLEALALVGLYPGCEFRLAGRDTTYCIDKDYGIITKVTILSEMKSWEQFYQIQL